MTDVDHWRFVGDETIVVDWITTGQPPRTLGEEIEVGLTFVPSNYYPSENRIPHTDRYLEVRKYGRYAGRAEYGVAHEADAWYQERLPPDAPVDSNVVQIAPDPPDAGGVFEGFWGLIVGVEDGNKLDELLELQLELVYLADASEYADRDAVESALAEPPV